MAGEPLGLIAGNGRFPFLAAAGAHRAGRKVVALALREEASPELEREVDEWHWISIGQLGRGIELLKSAGAHEAVMAGQVQHRQLFSDIVPDLKLMGETKVGHHPDWVTLTPDGKRAYVANAGSNSVSVVDLPTRKELTQIKVGQVPKRNVTAVLP